MKPGIILLLAVTVAACERVEQQPSVPIPHNWVENTKDAVARTTREPDNTRFRNVVLIAEKYEGGILYTSCGEFSAYSYGERADYKPFVATVLGWKALYHDTATDEQIKKTCSAPVAAREKS